ncbi:MAG TPA: lipoyl synthase [Syntrophales bacterium]|nr:lipoyl synthase [Syntrophales bacterium]
MKEASGGTMRKPSWLKVRPPLSESCREVKGVLARRRLHSVCQEALCPNRAECFRAKTATFLILGNVCTRRCAYCNIGTGIPQEPDETEAQRLAAGVKDLGLSYVVITSVTRDDLPDGGAGHFARCIEAVRTAIPSSRIEVLIPDFRGRRAAWDEVIAADPYLIGHNMETVAALFGALRPQGDYQRSLALLAAVADRHGRPPKSGFMVGLGEGWRDIEGLLVDLHRAGCRQVTIGQYLQPSRRHWPVRRYYTPEEFAGLKELALSLGMEHVEAGPLVRSSYRAAHRYGGDAAPP